MTRKLATATVCIVLGLFAMADPAWAFLTIIDHTQTTFMEELLADNLTASSESDRATRQFLITNDTGITWLDYHFRVSSETDPIVIFNEQLSIGNNNLHNNFASVQFSPDMTEVWFADGTVAQDEVFDVTLILYDDGEPDNLGPADVFGTPTIPEPLTAVLGLIGLGSLALITRRRA